MSKIVEPIVSRASGVTSKPAIEGHFKTGQRTITLDEPFLPYRPAIWQGQFDPVRHSAKPDSSRPLHPPQASFEDQITPSHSEGDARDNFANHLHQLASRVIGVERRYDF